MDTGKSGSSAGDATEGTEAVFAAVIRPHRSLGPRGFRITMALCALVAAVAAVRFVALGFWPVGGFLALDLVALFVALKVSDRRGRAFEEILLTPFELLLRHVTHRGVAREWRFNPLWTRLHREADADYGLMRLAVQSRGQRIEVARELSPHEREDLADAFGRALARVKRGG